jgi:hypothetical protein
MTTNPGLLSLRFWNASPVNMPRAHKMGHLDVRTYIGGFYCGDCSCSEHVVLLGIKQHHVNKKATIKRRVRSIGWDSGWDVFFLSSHHIKVCRCVSSNCVKCWRFKSQGSFKTPITFHGDEAMRYMCLSCMALHGRIDNAWVALGWGWVSGGIGLGWGNHVHVDSRPKVTLRWRCVMLHDTWC